MRNIKKLRRFFQNFGFERTTTKKSSFAGPGPKNCKSFGKTGRVLQEVLFIVFFILVAIPVFSQQEVGRITLDLRATEEVIDSSHFWYYAYFTSTLPSEYTGVQEILDIWETMKVSGYFIRHQNSFELKASYLRDHKMNILVIWLDYFRDGLEGHGVFRNACYWIARKYNLDIVVGSDDRYEFDYGWTNLGHLQQFGYYQYVSTYIFYRKD